ncbi:TonB-dependent receptor plug domain-containing protein [Dyella tabacisoli]|uniref:TonB-dependent receptor n=1 Tax=Dyella tabacisoli TaxID=2282381 RepID=A0A369UI56_9GAMM|nr:TonB-dependent receptor [Dyella tabacisoli]RDD80251.1 TonB-dependent receptor [Dyella tabacisoli]
MKRNKLALIIAGLLLAPVTNVAFAQSTPAQSSETPAPQQAKQLQTITVTGSAIPRVDVETPSPVTVITAAQIQRSGLTTVADVVRSISADNSGSIPNSFTAGFAAGAAGVALRGLTVNSTLVLIDGHRSATYAVSDDGIRNFVDLNTIPLAAIDRIEVLKDGASSLYGADAIAGVVNVILKSNYHGVEGTADIGTSQHGGGFTRKATLLAGGGDLQTDHYNAYIGVQYQKDNPINNRQRGFPFNTNNLSSIHGPNSIGGQPSQNNGSIYGTVTPGTLDPNGSGNFVNGVLPVPGAVSQVLAPFGCGPKGTLVTNDPANPGSYCSENYVSQYGQIQPAMEQGGLYGRFTVKLNDTTTAYMSASYFEAKTRVIAAPAQIQTSTPNNTNGIALPPGNPYNPFGGAGQYALINYAFGDIPGGTNLDNHSARMVGGVNGSFMDWNWDATVVINHTWLNTNRYGALNYSALVNAISSGTYNFLNPGANSAAARAAIAPDYRKTSTSDLDSLDLGANRQLWELPGGNAGLAIGAQFRHEAQDDPFLNPGNMTQGFGNAITRGTRNVSAAYFEFNAPLLQSLEVDLSGRFDHYTDIGNGFNPKVGFKYKPFDWVALRGTYSKGIRAPSFSENGSSSSTGFTTEQITDAAFLAAHNNNGYTQPYGIALGTVANKNIKPEKSTNYTLGIVLQPTSWLSASVDYYNIKKKNVIVPGQTGPALANYFAGLPNPPGVTVIPDLPDPAFPNALPRPAEIDTAFVNAAQQKTTGLDVDIQAHFDFANNIHYISELSGTQIFSWSLTLPDGTRQQFVGTHGPYILSSGAGTPRTRGSWANTIMWGPATITGTLYHTSGMRNIGLDQDPTGGCLSTLPRSRPCLIGSFTYFDLTGSYAINDHITITGSIMNAFDKKPPLDQADYAGNNYNPTWAQSGIVGRFYNLGVKVKL